jgi:hypothetical protein
MYSHSDRCYMRFYEKSYCNVAREHSVDSVGSAGIALRHLNVQVLEGSNGNEK